MPTTPAKSTRTLTRLDLAEAVYHVVGLSRKMASDLVDDVLEELAVALTRGDMVKLSGFGNFAVRAKRARMGRNPKTGVQVPITPRKVLVFRASHVLKNRMNNQG